MIRAVSTAAPIDVSNEFAALEGLGGGGVASFTGVVRGDDDLVALTLETHAAMAARALSAIAEQAVARFDLLGATLIHRHGRLAVGERIVLVGTAARHRSAALDGCAFLIDWAKTKAPYWKREEWADGTARWVEARHEDEAAAAAWR
ncbi:molybdenum cofactor biosynthesis protein MoaE [Sphingomonas sp.]|uniref:molybdenum cofactor biosynthesis protein MoaE n=1 Tax=Sphingomonas sp. TaxID=28214 RepID=UPI003AFFC3FB